jgi:STAS domain-containing protein
MQLRLSTRVVDDVVVVDCAGRIVFGDEAALLRDTVKKLLTQNNRIVLDLKGINYIDSGGLGTRSLCTPRPIVPAVPSNWPTSPSVSTTCCRSPSWSRFLRSTTARSWRFSRSKRAQWRKSRVTRVPRARFCRADRTRQFEDRNA